MFFTCVIDGVKWCCCKQSQNDLTEPLHVPSDTDEDDDPQPHPESPVGQPPEPLKQKSSKSMPPVDLQKDPDSEDDESKKPELSPTDSGDSPSKPTRSNAGLEENASKESLCVISLT